MKTIERLFIASPLKTFIFLLFVGAVSILFSILAYWLERHIISSYSTMSDYTGIFDWRHLPLVLIGDIASAARLVAAGTLLVLVGQLIVRLKHIVARSEK